MNLRINNFARMQHRRVTTTIKLSYIDNFEQIQTIPEMARTLLDGIKDIKFDKCFCKSYEDGVVTFELIFFVKSSKYSISVERQHEATMAMIRNFEQHGMLPLLKSLITVDELKK